ncbi:MULTISPECIES: phosphatase PAP2 family protein [Streptomyces]|uniref:Phosphatase PAP2 family protein n=1 Tax=Streptomyces cacaoi TaxID=1898 RepID=A0A4Y3R178_STRCI|nr:MULTISPECIES: phosphatase PAP2 family protein [Streptomyces]NNG87230.1 phosphatase PAP2 family protein [Streptomyces cacaoi]QHF97821.1 phosphatase PAP2 family protein [Streptomyces sp. NHF165]GEB51466.1 phosphatase PAP2 family protein [Streptomyces cacaoi]
MAVWDNPDVELLYDINGLAKDAPGWADRLMEYVGEYGIAIGLVVLGLWTWWGVTRKRDTLDEAVSGFAGLVWAPLGAVIALIINIPIRDFVGRPRPFLEHKGLDVLIDGKSDFSFVSDHATLTMAIAVGIFMVQRKLGLIAIVLAVLEGFCRVYMAVHYPTDVIGGLALGTAVALLLAPVAQWALTPLVRLLTGNAFLRGLLWAGPHTDHADAGGPSAAGADSGRAAGSRRAGDRDLAA